MNFEEFTARIRAFATLHKTGQWFMSIVEHDIFVAVHGATGLVVEYERDRDWFNLSPQLERKPFATGLTYVELNKCLPGILDLAEKYQQQPLVLSAPLEDIAVKYLTAKNNGVIEAKIKFTVDELIDMIDIEMWNDAICEKLSPNFVWGGDTGINWEVDETVMIDVFSEPNIDIDDDECLEDAWLGEETPEQQRDRELREWSMIDETPRDPNLK